MLRRDVISSFLHACLICSMMIFISCASQETIQGDEGSDSSEFGMNDESSDAGSDEVLELLEDDGGKGSQAKSDGDDEGLAELEGELSEMEEKGSDEEAIAGLEDGSSQKEPSEEEEPPVSGDDDKELADLLEGGGEATGTDELPESSGGDEAPELEGDETPGSRRSRQAVSMGRDIDIVSRTPRLPTEAFDRNGTLLNRFYMARQGDSWSSVSELLYGSAGRAKELSKWNRGSLNPGKVVFYNSPGAPSDRQMMSFYQERGIAPQAYSVKKGDWLSTIAKDLYGNIHSWREIAVVNGIAEPDKIELGQQLTVYPSDLRGYAGGGYAQAPSQPATPPARESEPEPEFGSQAQGEIPPPAPVTPPPAEMNNQFAPPPPPPPAIKPKKPKGNSIARLIRQELFPIAIGGIILLLALSLLIVNKRKKAAGAAEDFPDDGFATRPKARR